MKILILYYQEIADENPYNLFCLYDSMFSELIANGNNLLLINMKLFKKDSFSSEVSQYSLLKKNISNFNPELVITFNNQVFKELFKITDCPITLFDADAYELFAAKQLLTDNLNRYTLFTLCKDWIPNYLDLGFQKNQVHFLPFATAVKKENITIDKNISFIGTLFHSASMVFAKIGDNDNIKSRLYKAYLNFLETKNYNYQECFGPKFANFEGIDYHPFFDIRLLTLAHILDLGLTLHGAEWEHLRDIFPQLYCAYDSTPKYSLAHNQDLYNSSKICININHPQCYGKAFGWRVFDIMASNGCLISTHSSQLQEMTKGWVDIPMFHTPIEARELCLKLLKEENWRLDIVEASQKYIDANCRWIDRFKQMENALEIKLINPEKKGSIDVVNSKLQLKPNKRNRLFHLNTKLFKKVSLNIDIEKL